MGNCCESETTSGFYSNMKNQHKEKRKKPKTFQNGGENDSNLSIKTIGNQEIFSIMKFHKEFIQHNSKLAYESN